MDSELPAPFDTALLDRLMGEAGMDMLLATSKHNVQYLLGGHRSAFFNATDAMGLGRYLPVLVYPRGAPERAAYVGHRLETQQRQVAPFWPATARTDSAYGPDAVEKALAYLETPPRRLGVEMAFLPLDAAEVIRRLLPGAELVDATPVLERLRLRKSAAELAQLRLATEKVADAMAEAFAAARPGMTKRQLVQVLKEAEVRRGLAFEYCLITAGAGLNRAVTDQVIEAGDVISLDSGGNAHGYIGDICRMGIVGEPDAELRSLLDTVDAVQHAAFKAVRPGAPGGAIYDAALAEIRDRQLGSEWHFLAHGVGLVTHEGPRLTRRGPAPAPDDDSKRPLEPGMVVSIETTLMHGCRGFIKLEDTVAVTETGHEVYGGHIRGWTQTGAGTGAHA